MCFPLMVDNIFFSRLKDTQDQLCTVTKELIEVKQDRGNQELKWSIEKNKMLHNLELCRERLGENYPSVSGFAVSGSGRSLKLKSSQQLCAEIDSLKVRWQIDASAISSIYGIEQVHGLLHHSSECVPKYKLRIFSYLMIRKTWCH